jgi:tetratricopeptide (TPR) repeat protein
MENNPAVSRRDVATALSSIAILYRAENKLALAERAWSKALALDRELFGDLHPQVAWVMEMLADVYSARGEQVVAADYSDRAVESMMRLLGDKAPPTAVAFANRAAVEHRAQLFDQAAGDFDRALAILQEHPELDWLQKTVLQRYSDLLKTMHRNREAKAMSKMAHSFRAH